MNESDEDRLVRLYGMIVKLQDEIAHCEARVARRAAAMAAAQFSVRQAQRRTSQVQRARRAAEARTREQSGKIELLVANMMGIHEAELFSTSRANHLVDARSVAYLVARQAGWSSPKIGEWAGRDHTTVLYGIARVQHRPDLHEKALAITQQLEEMAA